MNIESQKKRGWFQIHLSTACVCMLTAALLLGANLRPSGWTGNENEESIKALVSIAQGRLYGWPFISSWELEGITYVLGESSRFIPLTDKHQIDFPRTFEQGVFGFREGRWNLTFNLIIAFVILIIVAIFWEYFIRRRNG